MEQPYGAKVLKIYSQCGMALVANLIDCPVINQQIATLDYAFNYWGKSQDWDYGSPGSPDIKSQVIFTDILNKEDTRWAEIKAIAYKGPVTWNERYEEGNQHRHQIRVYILTREDYYKWREEYFKKNPEEVATRTEKPETQPEPQPEPETTILRGDARRSMISEIHRRINSRGRAEAQWNL